MAPPTGHDLQLEAECRDVVAVFDVVHAKKKVVVRLVIPYH